MADGALFPVGQAWLEQGSGWELALGLKVRAAYRGHYLIGQDHGPRTEID